jgi:hypothetical protein
MSNVTPLYFSPDFGKRQILNACFQVLGTAPSSPGLGQYYYDSGTLKVNVWNGTGWDVVGSGGGSGTVTTVAVATAHGFSGSSDGNTTSPTLTINCTITGLLKGNGTSISAAASGTDYAPATSGSAALKGDGSGGFGTATINDLGSQTADYSANSHKITSLATPTSANDAVNKAYVDAIAQGLDFKASVRVIVTTNGTLSTAYANGQSAGGVTLATGDRIALAGQTTGSENGFYTVNASGAPTRATDADASGEISKGTITYVESGTNAGQLWIVTATASTPWVPGTDSSTWTQFTSVADLLAGTGSTKSGNTLNVNAGATPGSGGPGGGLVANADDMVIDTSIVARKVVFSSVGNASASTFALTHSLGTKAVSYSVRDKNTDDFVQVAANANSTSQITLDFGTYVPTSAQFEVIVTG